MTASFFGTKNKVDYTSTDLLHGLAQMEMTEKLVLREDFSNNKIGLIQNTFDI